MRDDTVGFAVDERYGLARRADRRVVVHCAREQVTLTAAAQRRTSLPRRRQAERGHLFAVAHEQRVPDEDRVVPGLALDGLEP